MGQRSKRAARCDACRMQRALCLCAEIPRLELATRVVLVMHHREVSRTTASGPLALRALSNGELHVHGARDAALDLTSLHGQGRRVMLLFPSDDARPLTPELYAADRRPVTLVVPDGNWRQASRAARRIPGLAQAERVTLVEGAPSRYRLRREPREGGLATFEAIARALGILESEDVQARLEDLFSRMVERTLETRGRTTPPPAALPVEPATPLEIIYRDADLVAVNKPAGMLVHRGWARDGRPALQILRDQLGRHVYPVHRLDRGTSGVLLFALSGETARLVQAQLDAHEVEKRYLALCRGNDPALLHVDHPLAKTEGGERRPAVTDFRLLGQFERYGLFEARPRTGRLHQIRRHLKHASHPIIGDARYGKGEHNRLFRERFGFHRLALHASDLGLRQPRTGEALRLHAPLPPEMERLFDALGLPPRP
jgi:tRNA pseudouridine65 synthase